MVFLKLLRRRLTSNNLFKNLESKIDDIYELKKTILERYKLLLKSGKSYLDNIEQNILIESSFVNDQYFLPPLIENKRNEGKFDKLANEEIYLLLFIVLFTPSLSIKNKMFEEIDNMELKNNYVVMLQHTIDNLMLSRKQKKMITKWKILNNKIEMFPNNFSNYTSSNIIQGFIGDCSFIVVLSLLLEHEKRYKSNLLTRLITPVKLCIKNNKEIDVILYLYKCKLLFNGIWRNIYIDNLIPIDMYNNCLLSHFDDDKYLGITLIEKAYLKVMANRYDSIGSNPAIDLYYLTGWIPETIPIKSNIERKKNFFVKLWNKIKYSVKNGSCLIALGTNEINSIENHKNSSKLNYNENTQDNNNEIYYKYIIKEEICKKTGLVTKHAYQVLRMVEFINCQDHSLKRLLLLRNPWGKITWKGRYSVYDKEIWDNDLQNTLNYNLLNEQNRDNGIFWIEWSDIIKWFSHIYLAWDPDKITKYHQKYHGKWVSSPHNSILKDDLHLLYFYPQYKISFDYKLLNKLKNYKIINQNNEFNNYELKNDSKYLLCFDTNEQYIEDNTRNINMLNWLKRKSDNEFMNFDNIGDIWIVLNRHIDYIGNEEEINKNINNKLKIKDNNFQIPYMSISIFTGKDRIVTQERLPIMQGVYSNGSVIMFKTNIFQLLREYENSSIQEDKSFILVITQFEDKKSFNYTLTLFTNIEFNMKLIETQINPIQIHHNYRYYELSGKILYNNYNEKYYIVITKDNKLNVVPIITSRNIIHSNTHNSTKLDSVHEKYMLLILLETKYYCKSAKLKIFPEYYEDKDKIIKISSSNDNYNNSNCKYIISICNIGNYLLLLDFKDSKNDFKIGNIFKLIIYIKKI